MHLGVISALDVFMQYAYSFFRYCVGYADRNLLDSTRYLVSKTALLPPQIKKVLGMVAVDEHFRYRRQNGTKGKGTLRASTCHFVAGETKDIFSSICHPRVSSTQTCMRQDENKIP